MEKLKEVDRVSVVSNNGSLYFNRVGGMWINHVKGETLDDEAMGNLIAVYEEFGWNAIYPETVKFQQNEKPPITEQVFDEFPGHYVIPDTAFVVVMKSGSYTHEFKTSYSVDPSEGMIYIAPSGTSITLLRLRKHMENVLSCRTGITIICYDKFGMKISEARN